MSSLGIHWFTWQNRLYELRVIAHTHKKLASIVNSDNKKFIVTAQYVFKYLGWFSLGQSHLSYVIVSVMTEQWMQVLTFRLGSS